MGAQGSGQHDVQEEKGKPVDLERAIRDKVLARDDRFALRAYLFIYESLAYTQKRLGRDDARLDPAQRHVSGQELLEGIRCYSDELFGPLAPTVFRSWGITSSQDFGRIVFNLVESKLLGKTEDDSIEDFANGFDIDTAFDGPVDVTLE